MNLHVCLSAFIRLTGPLYGGLSSSSAAKMHFLKSNRSGSLSADYVIEYAESPERPKTR